MGPVLSFADSSMLGTYLADGALEDGLALDSRLMPH